MAFESHYHEVLELLEGLFIFILNGLGERFAKEIAIVRKQYPVEEFKIPKDGKVLRLNFTEGTKLLREAGKEIAEYEDLK
jgi:aspartyl/asparaginyl-tRNA synthetase